MKTRIASLALLAASVTALSAGSVLAGAAQPILDKFPGRQPWHAVTDKIVKARKPGAALSTWKGGFTDNHGTKRTFVMVGPDPSSNNSTTTIPFELVPVIMKYPVYNMTFNPKTDTYTNGQTVLKNFLKSPLVKSIGWTSAGQDLGTTQYIDAFQRGTFWSSVKNNTNYHVVLGSPTVMKPMKITVQSGQGVVENNPIGGGGKVGTYGFGPMDGQINSYIQSHSSITPDTFVFFITHNIYLTSGGCCIGGYHYSTSTSPTSQSYGYTTLVTEATFSQDISAASHEIGEWMDDPYPGNNVVGCNDNSWLEVGDPLEHRGDFGDFTVQVGNFTYHPQDLSYMGYFGAPKNTSVNSALSFHGYGTTICPGQ